MARQVALTTIDNPYDPIDQFDEWFAFDNAKGYGTSSYLARIAITNDTLPDQTNDAEVERAIDEIVANDFLNMYKKIVHE